VPKPNPRARRAELILEGEVADPANPPPGCCFHPRCRYVQDICSIEEPALREIEPGRCVACHFAEELELASALEIATT
jgi:peptide/nickel transport system ATP-binding protein